jgi:hypothetical protein
MKKSGEKDSALLYPEVYRKRLIQAGVSVSYRGYADHRPLVQVFKLFGPRTVECSISSSAEKAIGLVLLQFEDAGAA